MLVCQLTQFSRVREAADTENGSFLPLISAVYRQLGWRSSKRPIEGIRLSCHLWNMSSVVSASRTRTGSARKKTRAYHSAPKLDGSLDLIGDPLGQSRAAKRAAIEKFRNAAKLKNEAE